MMAVDFLPEHLVILGGSYIGLEFGQMYRRFGSEVTIIQRNPHLIPREDEDISIAIREILEDEGIRVLTDADATRVAERGRRDRGHGERRRQDDGGDRLASPGRDRPAPEHRRSRTRQGGRRDRRARLHQGRRPAAHQRPGIYALGDCNGRGAFTHTSYNDFEIIAANLFEGEQRRVEDRILDLRPVHRPAARPRRHDREGGAAQGHQGADREDADGRRRARLRAQRDQGLHEDHRRRRDASRSSAPRCSASRATRSSRACST